MQDYEISMLLSRRYRQNNPQMGNQWLKYYYTRSLVRYITRLLFAIGWNKLGPGLTEPAIRYMRSILFAPPSQRASSHSLEPGDFQKALKECAEKIGMYSTVSNEIELLGQLRVIRNVNAHEITDIEFIEYYNQFDLVFENFANIFKNKNCCYIIPSRKENDIIRCYSLAPGESYAAEICVPSSSFDWDQNQNSLYYRTADIDDGTLNYYCLSPFICAPVYLFDENPHFRIYDRVSDFSNGMYELCYEAVVPQTLSLDVNGKLKGEFEHTDIHFKGDILFKSADTDDYINSSWLQSLNNRVLINISSYPGFGEIRKNTYKYCEEICSIKKDIVTFCRNDNQQNAKIMGNGGVGKTALALSVINDIIFDTSTQYSNVIFLSAKKSYYRLVDGQYVLNEIESEADISNYEKMIEKLAVLMDVNTYSLEICEVASKIVDKVNNCVVRREKRRKYLLVVDDLDSLDLPEQEKIMNFLSGFNPSYLKSIITTRNITKSNPTDFQLNALNEEQSLTYAKWYTEKFFSTQWETWSRKDCATLFVKTNGEGNPLLIQTLLALVNSGLECRFDVQMTKRERAVYFYNTVRNLLSDNQKTVFDICRKLFSYLPKETRCREMLLSVPEYLAAGNDIDESEFINSIHKLKELKLIKISQNRAQFMPYSELIISDDVVNLSKVSVPDMYKFVWEDVESKPNDWLSISNIENLIFESITSSENDRTFNSVVAMRIFERIVSKETVSKQVKERINAWQVEHDINQNNPDEVVARMVLAIRQTLQSIKEKVDSNEGNVAYSELLPKLFDQVNNCQAYLDKNPSDNACAMFENVREEINDLLGN